MDWVNMLFTVMILVSVLGFYAVLTIAVQLNKTLHTVYLFIRLIDKRTSLLIGADATKLYSEFEVTSDKNKNNGVK